MLIRNLLSLLLIMVPLMTTADNMCSPDVPALKGAALTFQDNARYSRLAIDSRLSDFYRNNTQSGLNTYDADGNMLMEGHNIAFDYVPGLVAKAVIEAAQYYRNEDFGKAWYYSVKDYANTTANSVPTYGGSLDNLNAAKMYFTLYDLSTGAFKDIAGNKTALNASNAMTKALQGLKDHNSSYSISQSTLASAAGGWWHKSNYPNQMWLDGQYMGPALLAQLINCGKTINSTAADDWDLITRQFTITWNYLWDDNKKLLYHAFSANPTNDKWANATTLHSQEFWGRAEGWYFLALVDVLDEMEKGGQKGTANYTTLRGYLNKVAEGLALRQDSETGCWYQLLQYDDTKYVTKYQAGYIYKNETKYNYLESSATGLFIAAFLKGSRLGLFDNDYTTLAKKAYKGFVEQFLVSDGNGGIHIINSCRSAGLSNERDGSAAYYLLGNDVTVVKASDNLTEGKALGAFILAATEYERLFNSSASSPYDKQAPFGYCNMSSRTDASKTYSVTGGGAWTYPLPEGTDMAVIVSDGGDMRTTISDALKQHKVVVLDGSKGPFLISRTINMTALEDRTILGINNATLITEWQVTDEIKKMLDDAGVPQMNSSSDPLGGTLPNGIAVREEAEYNTRLLMLQKYGNEDYRRSGFFTIQGCSNIIVRNIKFIGPGSIDVSGDDPVAIYHCYNVWIDHCDFVDGIDGNLDITSASDFNTVSWCTFSYTTKSYAHRLTNLIAGSEEEPEGTHNTTLAYNKWGALCQNRMPMARMGIIHELNNLFDCPNAGLCVNCNYHSSFLIEGNYFATGVKKIFRDYNSEAYVWAPSNYAVESFTPPADKGTVSVPYSYEVAPANIIFTEIVEHAGATLYRGVTATPTTEDPITPSDITVDGNSYMVMGDTPRPYDGQRIICKDITMTYGNDGSWSEPRYTTPVPEGYKCLVAGEVNPVDNNGQGYSTSKKNPPTKGTYYVFTPTADGTLTAAFTVYKNKELYITEDGVALPLTINGTQYPVGSILNADERVAASVTIPVKAGKTYHAFCKYSKVMFCGFSFAPTTTSIAPIPTHSVTTTPLQLYSPDGIRVGKNYRGVVKK